MSFTNKLFAQEDTIKYKGFVIEKDTIDVKVGWNVLGSISSSLDTSRVKSNPGGIILSKFFGYSNSGYFISDSILSGRGYWVKVSNVVK